MVSTFNKLPTMIFEETPLKSCYLITPMILKDSRGYFYESFNKRVFESHTGISVNFVQDNQSRSSEGVLRGLHFQKGNHAQAKLVSVVKGSVLDVCVDLRQDSETFGMYFSAVLSGTNKKQLFVPRGFAHGFLVLEDDTIFTYKCDNFYYKEAESGVLYNDQNLNIDWGMSTNKLIISEKDKKLPTLKELFP